MSGADSIILGNVTIGPAHPFWSAEDSMAASIVRLEGELTRARDTVLKLRRQRAAQGAVIDELRAEAALLWAQADILQANVEKARKRAGALHKCWIEAESERDEAREMAQDLLQKNAKQAVEIVRLKEAQ
jgi:predicted CoA-binding protein